MAAYYHRRFNVIFRGSSFVLLNTFLVFGFAYFRHNYYPQLDFTKLFSFDEYLPKANVEILSKHFHSTDYVNPTTELRQTQRVIILNGNDKVKLDKLLTSLNFVKHITVVTPNIDENKHLVNAQFPKKIQHLIYHSDLNLIQQFFETIPLINQDLVIFDLNEVTDVVKVNDFVNLKNLDSFNGKIQLELFNSISNVSQILNKEVETIDNLKEIIEEAL
eukprot:TRINITY_DN500_c0_g1_i1.p1 TRINITY_DN500_c0_g1~~TRINITY_DN500_c0_g1_i1.p1  ORF type:complete len:240 (+),score=58.17 TRINITY_DN500_c0_g1_i1:67-720(+)